MLLHAMALLCRTARRISLALLIIPLLIFALLCNAVTVLCESEPGPSLANHFKALWFHSIANHFWAYPCFTIAEPIKSMRFHSVSIPCLCGVFRLRAIPFHICVLHYRCNPKQFNSIPSLFIVSPCFALPLPGIGLPINSFAFGSSAIPLPITSGICNSIAYSAISSQVKRPIPEFRHWPMPLRHP